jgi:hypothetical protein
MSGEVVRPGLSVPGGTVIGYQHRKEGKKMTPRQQKAAMILGAALVGTYVLGNIAKGQARVLGLNAAQLTALTAGVAFALRNT